MSASLQRSIVLTTILFAALMISDSGYTKGKGCGSLPPEKALKCENCQTQCNNTYQGKLLKGGTPDQVAAWRKEHTQCLQTCLTK